MAVQVGLVNLGNVAQEVTAGVHGIVADTAHLAAEAGELVFDLVKTHVRFGGKVADHGDRLETYGAAPAVVLGHAGADEIRLYAQYRGQ